MTVPGPNPPFKAIDWEAPLDVEAYVRHTPRLPTIRGYLYSAIQDTADRQGVQLAPVRAKYTNFQEYPIREYIVYLANAAARIYPRKSLRNALRILGRGGYAVMAASLAGKVALGGAQKTLEGALPEIEKAYQLAMPKAVVIAMRSSDSTIDVSFERTYTFVDSHHVGVLEGFFFDRGYKAEAEVSSLSLSSAKVRCTLRPRVP